MTAQAPSTLPAQARTPDRVAVAERLPHELAPFAALADATRRLAATATVPA